MYYCESLGPEIIEITSQIPDGLIRDWPSTVRNDEFCSISSTLYENLRHQLKKMSANVVLYDETEQFKNEDQNLQYPFLNRKNFGTSQLKLPTRQPITGQSPPYQQNDYKLSEAS